MKVALWAGFLLSFAYALYFAMGVYSMGFVPFRAAKATALYLLILGLPLAFGAAIFSLRVRR